MVETFLKFPQTKAECGEVSGGDMPANEAFNKTSPLSTNRARLLVHPGRVILHHSLYPSPTLELPALSGPAVRELTGDILLPTIRTLQSDFRF